MVWRRQNSHNAPAVGGRAGGGDDLLVLSITPVCMAEA